MFLIRILEIVQHLPDTSWGGVGERGTGNFSTKKRYSRKQEKVKMAPIHGEPTCIPSAIVCSACALHVLVRRPQAGGTGLSRAAGHLHHTCGASHHTVGQREQELMCLTRAAQELRRLCKYTHSRDKYFTLCQCPAPTFSSALSLWMAITEIKAYSQAILSIHQRGDYQITQLHNLFYIITTMLFSLCNMDSDRGRLK